MEGKCNGKVMLSKILFIATTFPQLRRLKSKANNSTLRKPYKRLEKIFRDLLGLCCQYVVSPVIDMSATLLYVLGEPTTSLLIALRMTRTTTKLKPG